MARIVVDVEQLTALRSTFDRQGMAIDDVVSQLRGQLSNTTWEGPSAEAFRGQWTGDFEPALTRLRTALQEVSGELDRRLASYTANG